MQQQQQRRRRSRETVDHLLGNPPAATAAPYRQPPATTAAVPLQPAVPNIAPKPVPLPKQAAVEEDHGSIVNEVFAVAWQIASGPEQEQQQPTLKRQSSQLTDAVDWPFWQQVRRLGEACRTAEDWQRLLALLLGISLDPFMNKAPIYSFGVAPNPALAHGLRASRPARRRPARAEGDESAKRATARTTAHAERKAL